MAGHNGYGATRGSGRTARPSFRMALPKVDIQLLADVQMLAKEVRRVAKEIDMTPADVLARMRKDGVVDCNDEAASIVVKIANG